MSDTVSIAGVRLSRNRALVMGWIDAEGEITDKGRAQFEAAPVSSGPASNGARRVLRELAKQGDEPDMTPDGRIVKRREPQPLKPKNVTKTGEVITDEAELARIAEKTEKLEAAKAKKRAEG